MTDPTSQSEPRRIPIPEGLEKPFEAKPVVDAKDLILFNDPRFIDSVHGAEFAKRALRYQFIYSLVGLVMGVASMLIGMVLFLHGVAGHSSWSATILGSGSQLNDAAPGTVLFVIGLFVVVVTRFKVKVGGRQQANPGQSE